MGNPAVLVFLSLVAPWRFSVVRIVVGALPVFGVTALVGRLAGAPTGALPAEPPQPDPVRLTEFPLRYLRSLTRFALILLPEYVIVVMIVGALSARSSARCW